MALTKALLCTLLLASPILAEEQQESEKAGLFGLPDFSSFFGGGSGAGSMIPNFGNMFGGRLHEVHSVVPGDQAPAISDPSSDPAADDSEGDEQHNRLFFSLIPRLTACNFTTQAGSTCTSCRQTLTCLSSNVGFTRTCRGLFRYCDNGRCSLFQGAACAASTSSTSSTSSTTTTTTTTTTTPAPEG